MLLERINSPKDLKELSLDELNSLSSELREVLLEKLSKHGGHIGPNLGVVELIVAMHYVFDSPKDKFVFDVSHQSYIHKMLTGRKDAFLFEDKYDEVSGYTNPEESEHDFFNIGHTSTSISLACGLAKARDLNKQNDNVIAVIGDGSLSGGEAYEGLNNVVEQGSNMIVIVNDNDMSIAENHGGLYGNLKDLRNSDGKASNNFFKALGFEYYYVNDGHNLKDLIGVLNKVKDINHPVLIHIHTIKGKGFKFAEINKEKYHSGGPFSLETGEFDYSSNNPSYSSITLKTVMAEIDNNPSIAIISAGTPGGFGLSKNIREKLGSNYVDVGIAEEHAVAFASGMAKNNAKPVFMVFSTFLQRAYDQIIQDLCINNNPALILVYGGSVAAMNDKTHIGFYDIAMLSNIPNLVYLAPSNAEELVDMVKWGIKQEQYPVAIRIPSGSLEMGNKSDNFDYANLNTNKIVSEGKDVAIISVGTFNSLAKEIKNELNRDGINPTLVNPIYLTGLDYNLLNNLKDNYKVVITLEDGALEGGYGQKIASYLGASGLKIKNYGISKAFHDRYNPEELWRENGIAKDLIAEDIKELLK